MLAIDPGTSIVNTGDSTLYCCKVGTLLLQMVSEHCVACRICKPRIVQKPLENRSCTCSKTLFTKTLVNSFLNHFGFNSTSHLLQLDGKTYPWPKTTPCAKDFFNIFNSNDFNIFSMFTKDFQYGNY